jgi:hypothetical protein
VHVNVFSDPHGSFCERGVPRRDPDVLRDCLTSPAGDDEVGELAIVWEEVAGSVVLAGDNGGRVSLLAELGDLLLEVADRVLIGGSPGDEGSRGGLGDVAEGFGATPGSEGLEYGEGGVW